MNFEYEKKLLKIVGHNARLNTAIIDKVSINYLEVGLGDPLVLIHGANIGWGQWYQNIGALAKTNRVIAIDLPGAGGSTKIDYRSSDLNYYFVELTEKLLTAIGADFYNIVGHSIGGWIGCKIKIRGGVKIRKLALINPLGLTDQVPNMYRLLSIYPIAYLLSRTVMKPSIDMVHKFFLSAVQSKNIQLLPLEKYYFEGMMRGKLSHPLILMNRFSTFTHVKREYLIMDDLNKIARGNMIILSDHDPTVPLNKVVPALKRIQGLKYEIVKDTGHAVFLDRASEVNSLILNFIGNK